MTWMCACLRKSFPENLQEGFLGVGVQRFPTPQNVSQCPIASLKTTRIMDWPLNREETICRWQASEADRNIFEKWSWFPVSQPSFPVNGAQMRSVEPFFGSNKFQRGETKYGPKLHAPRTGKWIHSLLCCQRFFLIHGSLIIIIIIILSGSMDNRKKYANSLDDCAEKSLILENWLTTSVRENDEIW